ncbi:hypothetical protein [Desulforamulus aeronauticus]|uniref:Uncharacterized protein n=1 Tax=Desulforamulus aeronauticus DSM 10349 TaxID=1121421 RepID=A0A1M6TPD5_9FIRM|nr:hypothetical protein [Desulforamulus aeronauticus]SHK58852.1 hypothetical protein SAMN02745123_02412 [Desulforamulus aeronauticus DSM 10349]
MKDPINRIWDVVDEVIEENLELFLEDESGDADLASNFESIIEDSADESDDEETGYDALTSDFEDELMESPEKDRSYWLKEFENILGEHMPESVQVEKASNSRLPLILGGGGILLLGLITSTTVLIRLKKRQCFRALPVMEEEPVEVEVEVAPAAPEPKKRHQVRYVRGPFFMLHQMAQNLMPRPLRGGMHE